MVKVGGMVPGAVIRKALDYAASVGASQYRREAYVAVAALEVELDALRTRLELIARNASSWHHDDEAKQRALNVISAWASGGELPASLVADLVKDRPE